MQPVSRGLTIGLLYRINGTSRVTQLIATHGLPGASPSFHDVLRDVPAMIIDAALTRRPQFGVYSDELPDPVRHWLRAIPAGQFAVLPLADGTEAAKVLVLLGADPTPLSFPLRSSLVSAAETLARAWREDSDDRAVPGAERRAADRSAPPGAAPPAPGQPAGSGATSESSVVHQEAGGAPAVDRRLKVVDLVRADTLVPPETLTDTVVTLMEHEPQRDAIVLGSAGVPCGLVTRQRLLAQLSQLYGNALYRRKAISELADEQPLIVNGTLPPNEAALRATQRPAERRYDPLVVTIGGLYHGLVAVSTLLDHLNGEAMRRARLSNALSGLPGAVLLEAEVAERLATGQALSLVLADLDNFKPYNDYYGLARGDRVLLALARLGQEVVTEVGGDGDVFGHVGGDDFLILTTPERARPIAEALQDAFGALAEQFYDLADLKRKGIVAEDRAGQRRFFPLLALSVVAVGAEELTPATYLTLTVEASRRKVATKQAKRHDPFSACNA